MTLHAHESPFEHGRYTVPEAAYIAETDERMVEREIEAGVLAVEPERRQIRSRLLGRGALYYLAVIKPYRTNMGRTLRLALSRVVRDAVAHGEPRASFGFLNVELEGVRAAIEARLSLVERLRDEIAEDPHICSGEPVLKNTRHRVHQVADLRRQGVSDEEFRDELGLSVEQVETAVLYDRLRPRRGRPSNVEPMLKNVVEHVSDHR